MSRNGVHKSDRVVLSPDQVNTLAAGEPPHSPLSENSVIGSMFLDPRVIGDVMNILPGEQAFYSEVNGAAYKAIIDTWDRSAGKVDLSLVFEALDRRGVGDERNKAHILACVEGTVSAANVEYHAKIVRDRWRLREVHKACGVTLWKIRNDPTLPEDASKDIIDGLDAELFRIGHVSDGGESVSGAELMDRTLRAMEAAEAGASLGIPTGLRAIDATLGGLQRGELIIIAARPGMGKSSLGMNLAELVAVGGMGREPVPTAFFSLEMSSLSVGQRLIAQRAGVPMDHIRRGYCGERTKNAMDAANDFAQAPIHIDDTPGLTIARLRSKCRRLAHKHGVKVFFVDYLQLVSGGVAGRESRQVEVSAVSRGLKLIARELDAPVVALAQINRANESREDKRPRLSDLRESGSIEQDADSILFIHREAYYRMGDEKWLVENDPALSDLIVAKQRNGPTGIARVRWDGAFTRFRDDPTWQEDFT